jgi:hypothetical protein
LDLTRQQWLCLHSFPFFYLLNRAKATEVGFLAQLRASHNLYPVF